MPLVSVDSIGKKNQVRLELGIIYQCLPVTNSDVMYLSLVFLSFVFYISVELEMKFLFAI